MNEPHYCKFTKKKCKVFFLNPCLTKVTPAWGDFGQFHCLKKYSPIKGTYINIYTIIDTNIQIHTVIAHI